MQFTEGNKGPSHMADTAGASGGFFVFFLAARRASFQDEWQSMVISISMLLSDGCGVRATSPAVSTGGLFSIMQVHSICNPLNAGFLSDWDFVSGAFVMKSAPATPQRKMLLGASCARARAL